MKTKLTCAETELIESELIGTNINIEKSTQKELIGKKGVVIDETMNTFKIKTPIKDIVVQKKGCVFEFEIDGKKITMDGEKLQLRPQDRLKKLWRRAHGMRR